MRPSLLTLLSAFLLVTGCDTPTPADEPAAGGLMATYTTFELAPDLSGLSDAQREIVRLLIEAGQETNEIFWQQAYGDPSTLLAGIEDPDVRRYLEVNFGPYDRLNDNAAFLDTAAPKPAGANFYPADLTREELETAAQTNPALLDLYTMVRRDAEGNLVAVPYHEFFAERTGRIAENLREAATLAEDAGFRRYLELRADAIETDDYYASDMAWMDMKDNTLDVVIGPIETYEDQLMGAKAAYETFVLLKDAEWSQRLQRYAELLPELQEGLPVPADYKREMPGRNSDLGAYDVIYVAGDANAGSKTIAINLPNDEDVQLAKGTRRLQLKNAMRAKFDQILLPIAGVLIDEEQREDVTFDAFFGNTMFHEVAHGLGIKKLVADTSRTVREALQDQASSMEEGKADVLGLYMVTELIEQGEWDTDLEEHYATFLASVFRSIRFGGASAHGRANLIRFNFFQEQGAFTRDAETGTYRVEPDRMAAAVDALSERILTLQGDGDYAAVGQFVGQYGTMGPELAADLERVNEAGIPVDIVYEQGLDVLGLD